MLLPELFLVEAKAPVIHDGIGWYNSVTGESLTDRDEDQQHLWIVLLNPQKFGFSAGELPDPDDPRAEDWVDAFDDIYGEYHQRLYRQNWVRWRMHWSGGLELLFSGTRPNVRTMLSTRPVVETIRETFLEERGVEIYIDTIDPKMEIQRVVGSTPELNELRRTLSS